MENKINEVKNYFTDRITACDFIISNIEIQSDWVKFEVDVDNYDFCFSIHPEKQLFCFHSSNAFLDQDIIKCRLSNLVRLAKEEILEVKKQRIQSLKAELEKLEAI